MGYKIEPSMGFSRLLQSLYRSFPCTWLVQTLTAGTKVKLESTQQTVEMLDFDEHSYVFKQSIVMALTNIAIATGIYDIIGGPGLGRGGR